VQSPTGRRLAHPLPTRSRAQPPSAPIVEVARNLGWRGGVNQDVHANDETATAAPKVLDGAKAELDFDAFYRAHYSKTVRLARLLTGSATAAEDLAQEAFIRVHRHASTIDNPGGFLRTATVNVCHNWYRSRGREALRMVRLGPPPESLSLDARELDAVVAALPYRQRAVLVLRYWLDLTEADIARSLECRAGTVKSLQSRALATLRKELPR
jgi:RNA polymerase sigma factor (sigma-70 family)